MQFTHLPPSDCLKDYIKCYYFFESASAAAFEDIVFPSGEAEVIFNLGNGVWEAADNNQFLRNPAIEFWGQLTKPLAIKSCGAHSMLGIRFHTHAAGYFFNDAMGIFNNQVTDMEDIAGRPARVLHQQLLETTPLHNRIDLVERFLLERLSHAKRQVMPVEKIARMLASVKNNAEENNLKRIASAYNITTRYLQKLFYNHTGLSPKSFNRISRFQLGLKLIAKNDQSLTAVAYECGYFDQSHFIRDFKSFTGVTPSAYLRHQYPVNQSLSK